MNGHVASYFPAIRPRTSTGREKAKNCGIRIHHDTWPDLWRDISISLQRSGYQQSTEFFYRHIIRKLSRFTDKSPREITAGDMRMYARSLAGRSSTWHWTAMNISVLRTVFDKFGGMNFFQDIKGPRRKRPLPEYLNRDDVARLLGAATTLRDQLLLAFMYGCGLKVNELQMIRWQNILIEEGVLCLPSRHDARVIRRLPLPRAILPIIKEGAMRCPADHLIFSGAKVNNPLCARAIENVVSRCAAAASLPQTVTPMILRHSFAVHTLESGATIRYLQEALDHQLIETTMRYQECVSPVSHDVPTVSKDIPAPAPHEAVSISEEAESIGSSVFPMTDPQSFFLSALKKRMIRHHTPSPGYFDSR